MPTKPNTSDSIRSRRWIAPRLKKLGDMRDVAGNRIMSGNTPLFFTGNVPVS